MSESVFFKESRTDFEKELKQAVKTLSPQNKLRDACAYALLNGGKRIRPLIILMIAKALGKRSGIWEACLSVEFFHTASLITDDLPCMDNDDMRREKPALHKVFGETTALLASYALICEGFGMIKRCADRLPRESSVGLVALEVAAKGAGIQGATGGQFFDLFPKSHSFEDIKEVIEMKTVTLFEVAFVFGWLFSGGELSLLSSVKRASYHFGMAFQIRDDLSDFEEDLEREETSNLAVCLGEEQAHFLLEGEVQAFKKEMKKLQLLTPEFLYLLDQTRASTSLVP